MKSKTVKVPFEVDARVRATSQIVVERTTDLDLAPDGTLAVAAQPIVFARDGASIAAPGDLAGNAANHVAWSPDGARIATLAIEWRGNDVTAHIAVHAWPSGESVARVDLANFSSVSHALPGTSAPTCVWSRDGARVFVRSSKMSEPHVNTLGILDVAKGALVTRELDPESYLFSIATDDERVFALFSESGTEAGLAWFDAKTLAPRGHATTPRGECVVSTPAGVWVVGDARWTCHVDVAAIESKHATSTAIADPRWKKAITGRWERLEQLKHRAKAKWDRDALDYRRGHDDDFTESPSSPDAEKGVTVFMHPEPERIAQACVFGGGIIVRDGIRVALWTIEDSALVVTPLIEDLQRATTAKARHRCLAVAGNRFAIGWQKATSKSETTCTVFELDA